MYDYDHMLNGQSSRAQLQEKIQAAEKYHLIHSLPSQRQNNSVRNMLNNVLNMFS